MNEAYEDPPKTEEQILHPEKYERDEEPVGLSLRDLSKDLGKGWKQEMDSVFGEFDVYNWLRSTLENEFQAQSAGVGWGGGRVAVYAKPEEPASVFVHVALVWDNADEAREFFTTFQDVVRLIDPKPVPLDPSGQIMAWQGDDEMGQAWIDWTSFQMVVGVAQDDLATALEAIDAPTKIPESGHLLKSRPSGPGTRPQIRRLEGVLLEVGDLPPGFVLVQSGDTELQNPVVSQGVEQRFAVFADVRSEGDGVVSLVSRVPGALPAGTSWSWLEQEDPRLIFESLVAQLLLAGNVRDFSRLPLQGIGEGVVAARGVVTPMDGSPQLVKAVVFGRGATLAIVVTFQDTSSPGMNAGQLARIMDERLRRYTP